MAINADRLIGAIDSIGSKLGGLLGSKEAPKKPETEEKDKGLIVVVVLGVVAFCGTIITLIVTLGRKRK